MLPGNSRVRMCAIGIASDKKEGMTLTGATATGRERPVISIGS